MNKVKTVHTPQDVKGIIFMVEYVNAKHFHGEDMGTPQFQDIESIINDGYSSDIKESTIRRICTFRTTPTRISYKSLNIFTQWCFEGDYASFKKFLQERNDEINQNFITDKEVESILNILQKKNVPVYISHDVKVDLGNIPVSFNLGEGFVSKLIEEVSVVTGDLLTKRINKNPQHFGISPNKRIDNRIWLREERWQSNIENIVLKAIEFARRKEGSDNPVNPDWIVGFFNIAQDCSNSEMQYLWAKLLANEIDKPHSISRRTLSLVKLLEPKEAQVFTALCNCIWTLVDTTNLKEKVLIKDMYKAEEYSDESWGFDSSYIPHLESIGLVYESFIDMKPKRVYKVSFFDTDHKLQSNKKKDQLEIICLTKVGKEIFDIIDPTPNKNYYEITIDYFKKVNILKK